jgi:hypothetical protein
MFIGDLEKESRMLDMQIKELSKQVQEYEQAYG